MYGIRKHQKDSVTWALFLALFTFQSFAETTTGTTNPGTTSTTSTTTTPSSSTSSSTTTPSTSTASNSSSTPTSSALQPQNNSGSGGETTVTLPPPPPAVSPGAPPQQSDRKEGSNSAAGMAAAAAAIAGASCAMMMAQAMQMPPGQERNMMMMMAMQQCAQAAQNAASAAQNKDNAKKLSQADVPKQAELQAPQQIKVSNGNGGNGLLPELTKVDENPIAAPATVAAPEEIPMPEVPTSEGGTSETPEQYTGTANAVSFTKLTPIETASNFYKDGNEKRVPTPSPATFPTSTTGASIGNTNLSADALKKMVGIDTDGDPRKGRGASGGGGGGEIESLGSASGGESSGSAPDNSAFDAMLAQLMGPPTEAGAGAYGAGAGQDFVSLPTNAAGEQKVNIFQYASFRYQYAAYNENKIKLRQPTPPPQAQPPQSPSLAGIH